jgi:hypothetical protein
LNLSKVVTSQLVNETQVGNRFVRVLRRSTPVRPAGIGLVTGAKSLPTITITDLVPLGAPTNVPRGRVSSGCSSLIT